VAADQDLAERVRVTLAGAGAIREVRMFGGIGYLLNGNMVAASSRRGLLIRVGKERHRDALTRPGARVMEMRGRPMEGYIFVDPAVLDDEALRDWLKLALAFVRTLPPKPSGQKSRQAKGKRK
jgi:TfoX/Sxy family transcriptional regulator of competence genes